MPVLSSVHQTLATPNMCQATSIHSGERSSAPMSSCQSHHMGRWGTYTNDPGANAPGAIAAKRTFNDLTTTLLHQRQRPLAYWISPPFCCALACSSRRMAREVGS